MKKTISTFQMRELDRLLINRKYNSSYDLLRYAGHQLYQSLIKHINKDELIVVLCGANNNGGDGLVVYEYLHKNDYNCYAFVVNQANSEENKLQQNHLASLNYPFEDLENNSIAMNEIIDKADVIVDALLGIGCSRDVDVEIAQTIKKINESKAKVISIDIASGLLADSGFMVNQCVGADITLVVGAYKHGHVLFDGRDVSGQLELVDIGVDSTNDWIPCFDSSEIAMSFIPRKNNVHKYHFKHVCVIGGSSSMMGSIALSATATLYGGAGLVSVVTNTKNATMMRALPYEIITPTYETLKQLQSITFNKDTIVYGMGVTKETPTFDVLEHLLSLKIPLIVDGDGLYHLSNKQLSKTNERLLVTPHLNELSILAKTPIEEIKKDVVYYVKEVAKRYRCTVICKGPTTIVCHQNEVRLYQVGNNGLASAGTGDVFAGLLASQIAQHSETMQAIETTLAIYDKAANSAKNKHGVISMIASDVVFEIANAIKDATE